MKPGAPLLNHLRYEAGAELGRGAQGVVLRVVDREAPGRALVAKVWHGGRFEAAAISGEFALLSRLDVPGLARAHDFGRDAATGACFFVEDFVDGRSARDFVEQGETQRGERVERLLHVLAELATTLAVLHEAGFVHGDVKPEHVRVAKSGDRVMLLDLGAAVASSQPRAAGPSLLTPAFAAPERLAGEPATALSDLFSLGSLLWTLATGAPPAAQPEPLRARAAWVPPSLADLIEQLLAPHPRDRPESAEAVLRAVGRAGLEGRQRAIPAPIGREHELAELLTPQVGVRYVSGGSGVGKSHLLREVTTRALLSGRAVRRLRFPKHDGELVTELVAFLRGESAAWPFTERRRADQPMLLVLDGLEDAPVELVAALDAHRCRRFDHEGLDVIAALREAPSGADAVELGPLSAGAFAELCQRMGVTEAARCAELAQISGRNPGFLLAAYGRVALSKDTVLERTRALSRSALELLGAVALCGGELAEAAATRGGLLETRADAELLLAGLLVRRSGARGRYLALSVRELATEIAAAVGDFELSERVAVLALADAETSPSMLLSLASSAFPPSRRDELLQRAAAAAEGLGHESQQIEALLALAGSAAQRTPQLLVRLERLTRSSGSPHPQVLVWLTSAAAEHAELGPLAWRRQAEAAARAADFERAQHCAEQAEKQAELLGDRVAAALALGTRGAVALFRADVAAADAALGSARARLSTLEVTDVEELARLDHNVGVVALYGDRLDEATRAFERSLALKRRLGDRAGVRSCLLNLGLSLSRQAQYDRAATTLDEALALAQALGQKPGRAWCLAARADVEVRRGDARAADAFVAEAIAIREAPPGVRADLQLLQARIALLIGDAARAERAVAELDLAQRQGDPMIDARALLIEGALRLARLPATPRDAARLALRALRVARLANLPELVTQATELLRQARQKRVQVTAPSYTAAMPEGEPTLWTWLEKVAAGLDPESAVVELLRSLRRASGAERAFLISCRPDGAPERAWGVDLEDFALPEALLRCDAELVRAALGGAGVLYQRDVASPAGRGARLALSGPTEGAARAVLLLEHRFRIGCFDALSGEITQRFATLASLALRLGVAQNPQPALPKPASTTLDSELLQSTALPTLSLRRSFPAIVGNSPALRRALARLDAAIDSDLPVLISGETGTGKELFARALHEQGPRSAAPFVAVNCAAIPEALFEGELFGHARGAFTGADRARAGLLARAEGGTLFLDEIGELPLNRQASLLRVLESRRYRAVGSDEEKSCDVRLVAATNRELLSEVKNGNFRQDLLYRVNVLEVQVPPLRERLEDVPELVQSFLRRAPGVSLSAEVLLALESHAWPGNVRELEHQVQRLLALGTSQVELSHLPRALRAAAAAPAPKRRDDTPPDERRQVERALAGAQGNITHAARALGITRHGLKKRMLRLGLRAVAAANEEGRS